MVILIKGVRSEGKHKKSLVKSCRRTLQGLCENPNRCDTDDNR